MKSVFVVPTYVTEIMQYLCFCAENTREKLSMTLDWTRVILDKTLKEGE
jgi:hypothetical protein